jgi:hypothetical protein
MSNIIFIGSIMLRYSQGRANIDLIHAAKDTNKYNITLFWADSDITYVYSEIIRLQPKCIIVFETGEFGLKNFDFLFDLNIPIFLFLDDTYYMTSCAYSRQNNYLTNKVNGIIYWYNNNNVYNSYKNLYPTKTILHLNSRYTNTNIYKDYNLEKKYDILFYGTRHFLYPYKKEKVISIQEYIHKLEIMNDI